MAMSPMMMNPMMMNSMAMNPLRASVFNPMNAMSTTPFGLAQQQNLSRFMNPNATGSNNPMMMSNPYAAGSSGYGGGSSGGYGMSPGASSGMGSSSGYAGGYGYDQAALGAATAAEQSAAYSRTGPGSLLTALGLSNENGRLDWPLAFRLIPPGEYRDTMVQTESRARVAVMQAAGGKATSATLQEATRDVSKLRNWLRDHEVDMAEATYRSGSDFLRRVEDALSMIGAY
jgi:hypothetical protein